MKYSISSFNITHICVCMKLIISIKSFFLFITKVSIMDVINIGIGISSMSIISWNVIIIFITSYH